MAKLFTPTTSKDMAQGDNLKLGKVYEEAFIAEIKDVSRKHWKKR